MKFIIIFNEIFDLIDDCEVLNVFRKFFFQLEFNLWIYFILDDNVDVFCGFFEVKKVLLCVVQE